MPLSYEERYAQAEVLFKRPITKNRRNQKFPRGAMVKVADEMPPWMSHFEKGFIGVVEYCYAQKYGGKNVQDYRVIQLDNEGVPINSIAWYHEEQLTRIGKGVEEGKKIIERYK